MKKENNKQIIKFLSFGPMNSRTIFVLAIITVLSLLSMAAWLYEIVYKIGWPGLNWISAQHLSVFAITAAVVFAFLLPFEILGKKSLPQIILPFFLLYFFSIVAFFFMKFELKLFFSQFFKGNRTLMFLQMITIPYLIGYGYYLVGKKFLLPVKAKLKWQISFGIVLVVPFSMGSVKLYGGLAPMQNGFIDAIKMGYPFFWITLIMGIIGIMAVKQADKVVEVQKESRPDILDDLF